MKYLKHHTSIKFGDNIFTTNRINDELFVNSHGMTLMEVLIAITVLGIGLLAIMGMESSTYKSTGSSKNISKTISKGTSLMEYLISLPESHPDLEVGKTHTKASTEDHIDNNNNGLIDETDEPADMIASWIVTDNQPVQDAISIEIILTHQTLSGIQKTVTLGGIKANKY